MSPDDIRAICETVTSLPDPAPLHQATPTMGYSSSQFVILREIAAQLAEQNQQMREEREYRQKFNEAETAARIKRDELLEGYGTGMGKMVDKIVKPTPIPPRVVFPGEVVHLGCLIREPDGTHAIASDAGLTRLSPEEAQRILSLLTPESEGKPQ